MRLELAIIPPPVPRIGHRNELGIEPGDLSTVLNYWRDKFDWREREALLNLLPQFTTSIDGVNIHFIHVKASATKYPNAVPIMLVHGWPSTAFDFRHLIPMLVDPLEHGGSVDDAFHVVVPSMPGFPLSGQPIQPKCGAKEA